MKRTAFFISDGTGITAEGIGHSLLAQFDSIEFEKITLPYIDSIEKAKAVVLKINEASKTDDGSPIVFDTLVDSEIRAEIAKADAFNIDVFGTFLEPLEQALNTKSTYQVGKSHSISHDTGAYEKRIDAVNYALDNDDGARTRMYNEADIIITGVSRSGKTPTCLYLALQYGLKAANYPITEEDIQDQKLPSPLKTHKQKIFGLTIEPDRLAVIRNERKPNSRYSSIKQCNYEVEEVELMYRRERIPFLNTTAYSVEEIATRVMVETGIKRRVK